MISNSDINAWSLNPLAVAHNLMKVIDEYISTLSNEFCTVQILVGLGDLYTL